MKGDRMRGWWLVLVAVVLGVAVPAVAQRKPPYWVSIDVDKARMRTGPGRNYPASWLYQRRDLPLKVLDVYGEWRKVEDPGGTQGWMLRNFLDERRTGIVVGGVSELRATPEPSAHINWRVEPGVVGRLSKCAGGWCRFDVGGRAGYIEQARLWGVEPGEVLR
jgi:SH3-like domain-containing protein